MKKMRILSAAAAVATTAAMLGVSSGAFNAYIGYQTTTYSFRNKQGDSSYGIATPYFNSYIVWGDSATDPETFPEYEDNFDYDINGYVLPATYTDVEVTADGTYTVKAEDIDWSLKGESDFNLIFVSTDLPISAVDDGVKVTEAKIIVDGEVVKTVADPICDTTDECFNISLANIWNTDIGSYGLAFPTSSLAVEFTIEGLGAAAEEAAPAETEAAAVEEAAPAETEAAPVEEAAPAETTAAAAGDVQAATTSAKGSPNTGIEDVAVIAGLAVLAGGAVALTRKKK